MDRAKAFHIRTQIVNGNDPIESYLILQQEMEYIRKTRKPVMIEARVSRLYGHSSATGANLIPEEDCLKTFERLLLKEGVIEERAAKKIWSDYEDEAREAQDLARTEPAPTGESVWENVYANGENGDWRKF